MKTNILTLVAAILLQTSVVSAARRDMSDTCDLQLWQHRHEQWHDVIEGFTYGFYESPPVTVDECVLCDYMGRSFADVQSIVLDLEFVRGLWITLDFFDELIQTALFFHHIEFGEQDFAC